MGTHWKNAKDTMLDKLIAMQRIGLVTDMDGTISYITEKPEDAVVTPRNYELLQELNKKLTLVAIISGRSVRSVTARMTFPGVTYIGNHGLEHYVNGQVKYNFDIDEYIPKLDASVAELQKIDLSGVQVEDKGITVTLHYRQTENSDEVREQLYPLVKEIAAKEGLDFFEGRMIFELRPPVKANKGIAFEKLVHELKLDSAIYIGDDTTDIAALTMARQLRQENICYAIGIGVMSDNHPEELPQEADLLASGVSDVENLFTWILENLN
ncbi:MAG: trehalose-phosphatase [Anaerolineae bacterium]|nr:trehalose-phosphatase [Anaerolineae bacterium]